MQEVSLDFKISILSEIESFTGKDLKSFKTQSISQIRVSWKAWSMVKYPWQEYKNTGGFMCRYSVYWLVKCQNSWSMSSNYTITSLCESVQIQSYFRSVFSYIRTEYRKIRTRNNSVFGHFSRSACGLNEIMEQEGLNVKFISHLMGSTCLSRHQLQTFSRPICN